jgi:hypothetical protein
MWHVHVRMHFLLWMNGKVPLPYSLLHDPPWPASPSRLPLSRTAFIPCGGGGTRNHSRDAIHSRRFIFSCSDSKKLPPVRTLTTDDHGDQAPAPLLAPAFLYIDQSFNQPTNHAHDGSRCIDMERVVTEATIVSFRS